MIKKYLNLTFADEGQKQATIRINNPKEILDADAAKAGAQAIVDAGVFRAKGKFAAPLKGELVTINSGVLFGE